MPSLWPIAIVVVAALAWDFGRRFLHSYRGDLAKRVKIIEAAHNSIIDVVKVMESDLDEQRDNLKVLKNRINLRRGN